jgi:hypothetical protein
VTVQHKEAQELPQWALMLYGEAAACFAEMMERIGEERTAERRRNDGGKTHAAGH